METVGMKLLLVPSLALGLVAVALPAQAVCIPQPDGPQSAYVLNGQQQVLCLQGEIASDTARRNYEAQVNAQLQSQQMQLQQQRFQLQQHQALQMLPAVPVPSWP